MRPRARSPPFELSRSDEQRGAFRYDELVEFAQWTQRPAASLGLSRSPRAGDEPGGGGDGAASAGAQTPADARRQLAIDLARARALIERSDE